MKKSRYSLFVALALAAISTSACEDTVSLSVKCDGNQPFWTERNGNHITGGKCNGGIVEAVEFDVELALSKGEKAIVCNKDSGCDKHRYILSATDDKRIVAEECKEGDIECGYCCDNDRIAKCKDTTNAGKTNSLCGDGDDKNTSYQCQGTSVIVQKCKEDCVDGKCTGSNIEGCENGTHQCNGEKIEICVDGDWKDAVGAQLCDGDKILKCVGDVAKPQPCEDGAVCKDGECKASVCANSPDSGPVCNGGKVGKCENGNWIESKGNDLCENDKILYCENEDVTPRRVGCYSNDEKTHVCKAGAIDNSGCGDGMECNNSECKPKKYTCTAEDKYICANGGMLYDCNGVQEKDVAPVSENLKCEERQVVVWCRQDTVNKTECSPNGRVEGCAEWCTECNPDGKCAKCNKPQERCEDDLKGKTVCSNDSRKTDNCNYCYNSDSENGWVDSGKLGGDCVPNEYTKIDNNNNKAGSKVCYNGNTLELNLNIKPNSKHGIEYNNTNKNMAWEFAFYDSEKLEFYNCHNNNYKSEGRIVINCCKDKEGSYFIKRTGYKYYQIELCKERENHIDYEITAFQFSTALNDALIGKEENFLENDSACLSVKNEDGSEPTMLIKDESSQVNDGGAVYRAFKCKGGTECNSSHKQLCVVPDVDTTKQVYCDFGNGGTIMQLRDGSSTGDVAAVCPDGTVLQIKGNGDTWRAVVNDDCGVNKTHQLEDFRCYLEEKNTTGKESHS